MGNNSGRWVLQLVIKWSHVGSQATKSIMTKKFLEMQPKGFQRVVEKIVLIGDNSKEVQKLAEETMPEVLKKASGDPRLLKYGEKIVGTKLIWIPYANVPA